MAASIPGRSTNIGVRPNKKKLIPAKGFVFLACLIGNQSHFMSKQNQRIAQLLDKWHKGILTATESEELNEWFASVDFENVPKLSDDEFKEDSFFREKYEDILTRAERRRRHARVVRLRRIAVAASVLVFVSIAVLWMRSPRDAQSGMMAGGTKIESVNDILPGHEGAVLSLGDGTEIVLDSAGKGKIASQGKTIIANEDGMLMYKSGSVASREVLINTLSTPAGREYKLQLPDGSAVWLNASSSISFPAEFSEKERRVALQGEAFFEVAHVSRKDGSRIPFIVDINTNNGIKNKVQMEVLGTSFNVNAYDDESAIKTTLLQGSVKVHAAGKANLLKPAQQAVIKPEGSTNISGDINIDQVVAWKNGFFYFDHTEIHTILRQFSRWYGIEIIAANASAQRSFSGKLSRSMKLAEILKIMDLSSVPYTIKDGKMIFDGIVSK